MKKIKTVITLTVTLLVSVLNAQEQLQQPDTSIVNPKLPKVREFGIGLSGLNSFSLQYRWGNERRLYRLQGSIGGSSQTSNQTVTPSNSSSNNSYSPLNINCGLSFSILKTKLISEKFNLMYGSYFGLGYSFNQSVNENSNATNTSTIKNKSQNYSASIGLVLGAAYKINSSFLLYGEIDPGISDTYSNLQTEYTSSASPSSNNDKSQQINTIGLNGLSNLGAMLTIVYRITK